MQPHPPQQIFTFMLLKLDQNWSKSCWCSKNDPLFSGQWQSANFGFAVIDLQGIVGVDDLGQQIPMCFRSLLHKGISKSHPSHTVSHSIDGLFLPAPKVKAQLWRHQQQRWVFNFYFYWDTTIISRPCFQQQLIFSIVSLNGNVCWD